MGFSRRKLRNCSINTKNVVNGVSHQLHVKHLLYLNTLIGFHVYEVNK